MNKYELVKFKNGKFGVRLTVKNYVLPDTKLFISKRGCECQGKDVMDYCTMSEEEAKELLRSLDLFPEEVVNE
jgi:hypothetical protein